MTTAPGAQLVISSSLNVKNPGRFSQQPPLVRPNQGIRASSRRISCLQRRPSGARALPLTLSARSPAPRPAHLPPRVPPVPPLGFSQRGASRQSALAKCAHRRWSPTAFDLSVGLRTLPSLWWYFLFFVPPTCTCFSPSRHNSHLPVAL